MVLFLNISYWLEWGRERIVIGWRTRIANNGAVVYFRARTERSHVGTEVKGDNRSHTNRQPTQYWKQNLPKYKSRSCFLSVPNLTRLDAGFLPISAWDLWWAHWLGTRFSSIAFVSPVNYNIITTQSLLIFLSCDERWAKYRSYFHTVTTAPHHEIWKKCSVGVHSNRFVWREKVWPLNNANNDHR